MQVKQQQTTDTNYKKITANALRNIQFVIPEKRIISATQDNDRALTLLGNTGYLCMSRDARWTSHNRLLQIVI